ncbi:MAG TPA: YwiC-like family protein [Bacilli bacterium]|nr:YwiC-like family protein [Bacilli bacterium]
MKLVLPREHGSWGILFAPLLVGTIVAGAGWAHLLLFSGALAAFLAAHPLILWLKNPQKHKAMLRWTIGYGVAALLFGLPLLYAYHPLFWVVAGAGLTLLLNIWFAVTKRERHLFNDIVAIGGLSLGGVAAYLIGAGTQMWSFEALWIACAPLLLFIGSALHVKTMIREKGNLRFKRLAAGYHLLLLVAPMLTAALWPDVFPYPWLWLAYLVSALRTWLTPFGATRRPLTIGLIEIGNTVWFVIVACIALGS